MTETRAERRGVEKEVKGRIEDRWRGNKKGGEGGREESKGRAAIEVRNRLEGGGR